MIRALDETDLAAETSVEIVVSPREDAPTAQGVDPLTFEEDALENRVDLAPWFSDADQDMLSYTIGSLTGDETIVDVNVEESELVLRFQKDAFGDVTLGLTATDPGGLSAEIQIPITVAADPDAPLVIIQELEVVTISPEQEDHSMDASAWFTDPDPEDTLTYQLEVIDSSESLLASTEIDLGNGLISLSFTLGASGTADLRVTATDSTDRQVAFVFQVERARSAGHGRSEC
ncbi:MAG: hypothetical protein ACI8T1_005463 [Verrucomicrobiales bacterium]